MLRRCLSAALVLFVVSGLVLAESYQGLITKVEDGKITIKTRGKKKGEKGEEKTFKVSKEVKISKAGKKGDEPTSLTSDELKELVKKGTKFGEKQIDGAFGKVETKGDGDSEEVVKVTVGGFGGIKGKKKKE